MYVRAATKIRSLIILQVLKGFLSTTTQRFFMALWFLSEYWLWETVFFLLLVLFLKFKHVLYPSILMLPRDVRLCIKLVRWQFFYLWSSKKNRTILTYFYERAKQRPDDIAFQAVDGQSYTFSQFEFQSNRVAQYFAANGYKAGDCVALVMESRPDFVLCWYALAKLRIITSFINYNLSGDQLEHSLSFGSIKAIIFSRECEEKIKTVDFSRFNVNLIAFDGLSTIPGAHDLPEKMAHIDPSETPPSATMEDILCYIFTSGSSGLPKAVKIRHKRAFHFAQGCYIAGLEPTDRVYTFMPLYHLNSGVMIASGTMITGNMLIIRKKLSISRFTDDCINYNVNSFNYVGEVCRYLTAMPHHEHEHKLHFKFIFGNGIRPLIWQKLKTRFSIDKIVEAYGSSEGNVASINTENVMGSCGFFPLWFLALGPYAIVKCDLDGEPVRNENGRVRAVDYDEPGHLMGRYMQSNIVTYYDGYLNEKENEKKMRRDMFRPGDCYVLTGDLVSVDRYGNIYFVDRIGDTFRWKGENVSTLEVENHFLKFPFVKEAVVFGVNVPHHEGKAGMVAIIFSEDFKEPNLNELVSGLPVSHKPVFIKVVENVSTSSTMKHIKVSLKNEGFCLSSCKQSETIFVSIKNAPYTLLTESIANEINSGLIPL